MTSTTSTTSASVSTGEASRPLRKDAARNRALLLAAAREVFAQRGLDASLDDIARHAGLGVGTAYRHFANKFDLAAALMDEMVDDLLGHLDRAAANPDALAGLVDFLESAISAQSTDRGLREVMLGVHDKSKVARISERVEPVIADLVERAKAAGQLRPSVEPSDVGMIVIMLCTVCDVAAEQSVELWRRYLALCLDSICTERRSDDELNTVPALDTESLRAAMDNYKARGSMPNCQ